MEMITKEKLEIKVNTLLKMTSKAVEDFGENQIILITALNKDQWGGQTVYPEVEIVGSAVSEWAQPYELPNVNWDIEILGPQEDYPEYAL